MTREPPENATEREIIKWFFEEGIRILDEAIVKVDEALGGLITKPDGQALLSVKNNEI
jgi:hypothetical protein